MKKTHLKRCEVNSHIILTREVISLIIPVNSEETSLERGDVVNLKEMRLKANLLQQDVADALKINRSTVAKWETGETLPRADKLMDIAKLYGCSVDDLLVSKN